MSTRVISDHLSGEACSPMAALYLFYQYISGLVQDCSISILNAMEILQSCIKPLICNYMDWHGVLSIFMMSSLIGYDFDKTDRKQL